MKMIRMNKRGFTLVELMIVVAIVGVLAALAIYGVRKYVMNAKTSEARTAVNRLAKDAAAAFAKEKMAGDVLALGGTVEVSNKLCDSADNTVPESIDSVKGQKYQSKPSEWATGSTTAGWQCLGFSMNDPQYYMYGYTVAEGGLSFEATAEGNLDGDDETSKFAMKGSVVDEGGETVVILAPALTETLPLE